jgi:hypothetical protein
MSSGLFFLLNNSLFIERKETFNDISLQQPEKQLHPPLQQLLGET